MQGMGEFGGMHEDDDVCRSMPKSQASHGIPSSAAILSLMRMSGGASAAGGSGDEHKGSTHAHPSGGAHTSAAACDLTDLHSLEEASSDPVLHQDHVAADDMDVNDVRAEESACVEEKTDAARQRITRRQNAVKRVEVLE